MKINRPTLLPYLKTAFDLAADKSPLELFTLVRLVTRDDKLFIEATNGTAGLCLEYEGLFSGEVDVFVPSLFYENMSKLTAEAVELKIKDDKLTILGGKTKPSCAVASATPDRLAQWPVFAPDETPEIQAVCAENTLKKGFEVALLATANNSPDEIQGAPHRGNLLLKFSRATFECAGLHVYGFSRYVADDPYEQVASFTILGAHAKKIIPLLRGEGDLNITSQANRTYFHTAHGTFWTSKVPASYPQYERAIPETLPFDLDLDYVQAREFLDTALSLHNRGGSERVAFLMTLEEGILKMVYEGETGRTESEFEIEVPGSLRVGINLKTTAALYKKGMRFLLGDTARTPICLENREGVLHLMSGFHL